MLKVIRSNILKSQ